MDSEDSSPNGATLRARSLKRWQRIPYAAWLSGVVLGAVLIGVTWLFLNRAPEVAVHDALKSPPSDVRSLQQALATAEKNDEVSRAAIKKLQDELAARDAEIATLKEDISFYERFVGTAAQKQPLGVQEFKVSKRDGDVWQFNAVVARSNAGSDEAGGRLQFSVEGKQGDGLKRIAWADLRKGRGGDGVPFKLRYFQRVSGDFILPPAFIPTSIIVRLVPQQGAPVEKSLTWADAAT